MGMGHGFGCLFGHGGWGSALCKRTLLSSSLELGEAGPGMAVGRMGASLASKSFFAWLWETGETRRPIYC